jgi:8-oxo-dGTP pyrophosphatase MutT (NUDIX family)
VTEWRGAPTNLAEDEHDELRWVSADEIPDLHLAHPAYLTFLPGLLTAHR